MAEKRYQAFISYRHLPLDKAVAIRLQSLLESFKPPRKITYKHSNKISRIFRDESELPTSGDLGNDIITALEESEFLIVLCSPKLKLSKWCMREIEYFKQLHGGRINRILPILIDGDPWEAFPEPLKFDTHTFIDENGVERTEEVEVEPLACNIHTGGDIKKTLKLLNSEFLRIAAPILGCKFDDLYQRHRRRKIRRITTAVTASFVLAFVVSGLLVLQNRNVIASRDAMYIERSAAAYASGDLQSAVNYAMNAVQPRSFLMPDILPQAQWALTNALGVYDFSDGFRPSEFLTLPSQAVNAAISLDGRYSAVVYAFGVALIDMEASQIIANFDTVRSAMAEARFLNDNTLIFAGANGITAYDIAANQILWTGEMATAIAISANQQTIAAIYRDESRAAIYDSLGNIQNIIDFGDRRQRVVYHDIFTNPGRNLLELNADGSWLAVSFHGDDLALFDLVDTDIQIPVFGHEFTGFSGGFVGNIFTFSTSGAGLFSELIAVDLDAMQVVPIHHNPHEFIVYTNAYGLFVANGNTLIEMDLTTGTQVGIAETDIDANIISFGVTPNSVVIADDGGHMRVFDRNATLLATYDMGFSADFIHAANTHAIAASRNTAELITMQRPDHSHANFFTYSLGERFTQTRINAQGTRVMRYSPWGFRLYDVNGALINAVEIPDGSRVWNQQFSHASGNLAVIHRDEALRIYSGNDGALLFEATDLTSVFFAPYGVSILDASGTLHLIDLDTAQATATFQAQGSIAAYVGMVVDASFLGNHREIIGAARHGNGYLFAADNGTSGAVYNHHGNHQFDITTGQFTEVFFTDAFAFVAPMHGVPTVYSLQNGRQLRSLDQDAHLTNVHQMGEYIVLEFFSHVDATGYRFGILMNTELEAIAYLPWLTDVNVAEMRLFFDHGLGYVRHSGVFSLDELIR